MTERNRSARSTAAIDRTSRGFTDEERLAMKERAKELKAEAKKADGESALLEKIAAMPEPDRTTSERLHAIIKTNAPALLPKTWYGMPAYSNKEGKVVLFFRDTQKFSERYMTLGFNQEANLDEGAMWPVVFALKELNPAEEERIAALVRKAVS